MNKICVVGSIIIVIFIYLMNNIILGLWGECEEYKIKELFVVFMCFIY